MAFFLLYALYALDVTGYCIVIVIFAPMLLSPESTLVDPTTTLATRNLLYGLLIGAYPATQFFGAPILGDLSDRYGRRPILLLSSLGTAFAFFATSFAVWCNLLWLIFASRLIGGFLAGSMTVTQATIADLTPINKRGRYMSFFMVISGLGWTLGPYLGSLLSRIGYETPFWTFALAFLLCALLTLIAIPPSSKPRQPLHLRRTFASLPSAFCQPGIALPLAIASLLIFGWITYQSFLAPYLIQWYQFTQFSESLAYAVSSLFWFIGGLLANLWLLRRYHPRRVIIIPIFLSGLTTLAFLAVHHTLAIWPLLALGNIAQAIVLSSFITLFSLLASHDKQGKIFGAYAASQAASAALAPLLATSLARYWINLPYLVAALLMLLLATTYLFTSARQPLSTPLND